MVLCLYIYFFYCTFVVNRHRTFIRYWWRKDLSNELFAFHEQTHNKCPHAKVLKHSAHLRPSLCTIKPRTVTTLSRKSKIKKNTRLKFWIHNQIVDLLLIFESFSTSALNWLYNIIMLARQILRITLIKYSDSFCLFFILFTLLLCPSIYLSLFSLFIYHLIDAWLQINSICDKIFKSFATIEIASMRFVSGRW